MSCAFSSRDASGCPSVHIETGLPNVAAPIRIVVGTFFVFPDALGWDLFKSVVRAVTGPISMNGVPRRSGEFRCHISPRDTLRFAGSWGNNTVTFWPPFGAPVTLDGPTTDALAVFLGVAGDPVRVRMMVRGGETGARRDARPPPAPPVQQPFVVTGTGLGRIPVDAERAGKLRSAAAALSLAFIWADSPEGEDFWRTISRRLDDMSAEAGDAAQLKAASHAAAKLRADYACALVDVQDAERAEAAAVKKAQEARDQTARHNEAVEACHSRTTAARAVLTAARKAKGEAV